MNTTVQEYRDRRAKPFQAKLPSGMVFTLRRLSPIDYIREGMVDIPNEFFTFVLNAEMGKVTEMTDEQRDKNYAMFEKFLSVTVEKGIVDPPVVLTYKDDKKDTHLLWMEIDGDDQTYITGCITGRIIPKDDEQEPAVPVKTE